MMAKVKSPKKNFKKYTDTELTTEHKSVPKKPKKVQSDFTLPKKKKGK